jgi:aspartate kinase
VDAEALIATDETHLNAHPLTDLIEERVERLLHPVLDARIVALVAGFIGSTRKGTVTTLGRGGSDYTATLLASALRAEEVWIFTHVDGIMMADPQYVPGARVIPAMSYTDIGELAYFGARVIHPRAVEPLAPKGIPLRVRNPFNPEHAGTLIQAQTDIPLRAIASADGLCMSVSGRVVDLNEFLGQVQRIVGQAAHPVITMQSHQHSTMVYVVPTSEGPTAAVQAAHRLEVGLNGWQIRVVKVIAAIGSGTLTEAHLGAVQPMAFSAIGADRHIIAVETQDAPAVVRQVYRMTETGMNGSKRR